jgi:hypothetical protein
MHLHGETFERYAARDLPESQLTTLDEHVSNCMLCANAFAQEGAAGERWERRGWLGRLVRLGPEPVVADDLDERLAA